MKHHSWYFFGIAATWAASWVSACSGDENSDKDTESEEPSAIHCTDNSECEDESMVCDDSRSICVECLDKTDCDGEAICQDARCHAVTYCVADEDCDGEDVCDVAGGYCAECVSPEDCSESQTCASSKCRDTCSSDENCGETEPYCALLTSLCVSCRTHDDCAADEYCSSSGACSVRNCAEDDIFCSGIWLLSCAESGSGFERLRCGAECIEEEPPYCEDAPAGLGGGDGATGGVSMGGGMPTAGAPSQGGSN